MNAQSSNRHPELLPGEVFLTNSDINDVHHIGWTTTRCGNTAYSISNNQINGLVPVFVSEDEIRNAYLNGRIDIDTLADFGISL